MKKRKKHLRCVWWTVLFLLKYDLSAPVKEEMVNLSENMTLVKPVLVINMED